MAIKDWCAALWPALVRPESTSIATPVNAKSSPSTTGAMSTIQCSRVS